MGKQSARIFYKGKDHKDIFYKGNFHSKMYKGNQLLWEKLYPDECLLDYGNTGIYIYDIEHKCVDVMPFCHGSTNKGKIVAEYLETIGPVLHTHILQRYSNIEAHSMDGMMWKKENENKSLVPIYATYTENSRLFQNYTAEKVILRLNESDIIYDSGGEWNSSAYKIVCGKGENYKFYNKQKYLITVDESGNIVDEVYIDNLYYDYMSLWRAGNSIYASSTQYTYLYRLDESTNTMVAISSNFFNNGTAPHIIYSDEKETIVSISGDNYSNTWIASFMKNKYTIENTIQNGCVVVKCEDEENINVYVNTGRYHNYIYPYMTIGGGAKEFGVYMKNHQSSISKDKGFFFVSSVHGESSNCIACVYFDNPYFLESKGNRIYKLPNYS